MRITILSALLCAATGAAASAPDSAPRPVARPGTLQSGAGPAQGAATDAEAKVIEVQAESGGSFAGWVAGFRDRAVAEGIAPETVDAAFRDVSYNGFVVERDRNQAEFVKPIWTYLDTAVSEARVTNGRAAVARVEDTLNRVEAEYGVDKEVVAAIWGLESAYGAVRGDIPTIEALATLAFDARRAEFFEDQLLRALRILQNGDTTPGAMRGSWAGAMGHTQFMPSSYDAYAVDADGDGRRDIWADDPTDALASTAAYLKGHGWVLDQPWGVEVRLPDGFDYTEARRDNRKAPSDWAAQGIVATDGAPVADHGPASILLPAGAEGAAFMIFDNFEALEAYNTADAYVIGVGHLADRIAGGAPLEHGWPREDLPLGPEDRIELQERLTGAGFSTEGIDGRIGPNTVDAIRAYQVAQGITPDGYASMRLLERLR